MNEPHDRWEARVRERARAYPYPPTPDFTSRWSRAPRAHGRAVPFRITAALVIVLMMFWILSVPAVRAGLAEFLQVGTVRLWLEQPKVIMAGGVQPNVGGLPVTLEEAQAEVWYPIQQPSYPEGLGAPDDIYLLNPEEDGIYLIWYGTESYPELRLAQFGAGFWVDKWGPTLEGTTPGVTVNGAYAVWAPGPHVWSFMGRDGNRAVTVPKGHNVLIWTNGFVTYRLESTLPQEEAIRVAESIK